MSNGRITEPELDRLVSAFYDRVRQDEALGPVFEVGVDDWPAHLANLRDFWSSVMLTSGRYKGNPAAAHLKHAAQITPALFERWLTLWAETTSRLMLPVAAAALQAKAANIARSLQLSLYFKLPPKEPEADRI